METDLELTKRLAAGDHEVFERFYNSVWPQVFAYAMSRCGNVSVAEDIAAETFTKAWEALPGFQYRGVSYAALLLRIAHNLIASWYRVEGKRKEIPLDPEVVKNIPQQEGSSEDFRLSVVVQAFAVLTPYQKQIIFLRFVKGYNLENTALILGKSVGTIKGSQAKAIAKLQWASLTPRRDVSLGAD
jgi:RNA polymerase sigma-70 factor (ECF subfamily)